VQPAECLVRGKTLIGEARTASDDVVMAECAALHRALVRSANVSKAAKDLDISRATLHRKLKQLGLQR
jgi:transcriptional regulator of acetoin/glycerol metabolism